MEHGFHRVDVLDPSGAIIGQKRRHEINKTQDTYHGTYVLLVTPHKKLVFSVIPAREDLPNLYARQLSTTMATIRRSGESALEAAQRGISRELFIDDAKPELIGEFMEKLPGAALQFVSFFVLQSEAPDAYSQIDIQRLETMSKSEYETLVTTHPEKIAPTLHIIWQRYAAKIPA